MSEQENGSSELLLLGTEQKVFAFDLSREPRVTIGRHESNALQLESRTVSNYHAEIVSQNGTLLLRDLGSTNGTFRGDAAVQSEAIHKGDHLRFGNHHVTVDLVPRYDPAKPVALESSSLLLGPGNTGKLLSLRGQLWSATQTVPSLDPGDLTLPDLIKRACANPESLRVVVARGSDTACVWTRGCSVVHAEYGTIVGEKALYRLFPWSGGDYVVERVDSTQSIPQTISLPVNALVAEGMSQATELGKLVAKLPPLEAPLVLREDCRVPLSEHSPGEIEVFRLVMRHETIAAALEASSLADMRVLTLLESLIAKGVFEAGSAFDPGLKGTLLPVSRRTPS